MSKNEVAEHFNLGGERMNRTINRYEKNVRAPKEERLVELANLFNVNIETTISFLFSANSNDFFTNSPNINSCLGLNS